MTLENIYYIGQTVAVIAILGSLIALIFQLREQRRESRLAAMHNLSVEYRKIMDPMTEVPGFARLWAKSLSVGLHGLERDEFLIVGGFIQNMLRCFEEFMIQQENGRLNNDIWPAISKHLAQIISTKAFEDYWDIRSEIYTDRFRHFVDALEPREYRAVPQPTVSDHDAVSEQSPLENATDDGETGA